MLVISDNVTSLCCRLILELDSAVIATRVTMRTGDDAIDNPVMEHAGLQSLSVAFGNVKEQLARSLLK